MKEKTARGRKCSGGGGGGECGGGGCSGGGCSGGCSGGVARRMKEGRMDRLTGFPERQALST